MHEATTIPVPMTEEEREKVRAQMNRMLETHHFKNSRRYPALLRFIVEEALEGRGEYLKERLLGVRVFDRPADYDTAVDPVVRVTIAEIRKRIAQYYHDEEHDAEIRIELLPGHYAPEFRSRVIRKETASGHDFLAETAEVKATAVPQAKSEVSAELATSLAVTSHPQHFSLKSSGYIVTVIAVVLGLGSIPIMHWIHSSALEELWAPLFTAQRPILFCLPTDVGVKRGPTGEPATETLFARGRLADPNAPTGRTFLDYEALGENVVFSDMLATLKIANVLAINHRDYSARLNISTNLEDLREGPAILIGGLDNQWTMRALAPLRFHFAGSDEDRYWIADAKTPANNSWSLDLKQMYGAVTRDYAIIARLHNEQTGQPQMIVAGIGMSGTAAAGEFIGDERRVEELRERIGPGFKDHDFEAVLSTDVVNGIAGAPKIVEVAVW